MPTALITGINGQDGSYLAEFLLERGYRVAGLVRSASGTRLKHIEHLLSDLEVVEGSLTDEQHLRKIVDRYGPDEIYNFAARASSTQLSAQPLLTAQFNGLAVVALMEAARCTNPRIRFCQASSSEMYGDATESPQHELTPFRPGNPYGVAKLFAHGMVGAYREHFGLYACSGILFNHESPRRGLEFVTRKITRGVAQIKVGRARQLLLGDLEATRDWGFAGDYVHAMWRMLQAEKADDYVVATGESHSVREFCDVAFSHAGLDYRDFVRVDPLARRPSETIQRVGDATKIQRALGWRPTVHFEQLVRMMVDADLENVCKQEPIGYEQ